MAEMLGHGECLNCSARVMFKTDKRGRVYFLCDGNHDRKACGINVKYGAQDSAAIITKYGKTDDKDTGSKDAGNSGTGSEPEPAGDGSGSALSEWLRS